MVGSTWPHRYGLGMPWSLWRAWMSISAIRITPRRAGTTATVATGRVRRPVITLIGPVEIDVPRDRDGSFEPETVLKNQRRLEGVDSMVISPHSEGAHDR